MNKPLAKITQTGSSALRIIKAVGPLLISQSKKVSESYAKHQLRLANVDVARELMLKEVESLSKVRNNIREKYYESNPEERIRLKRDIEETEREIRRLDIFSNALDELPRPQDGKDTSKSNSETEQQPITLHWMDKFNEYARANNEDWRKDLLAKALAMEAKNPGNIGPRALWLIGTIDEYLFHAYASLLDLSTNIAGQHMIPNHNQFNDKKPIPNCALGPNASIGNLVFMLSDLGLIGDVQSSSTPISEGEQIVTFYGDEEKGTVIITKKALNIRGVIPTRLGHILAKLYTPKPNELGLEIYNKWLESINETVADKQEINILRA